MNIGGNIRYFNLQDWWLAVFSEKERRYIEEKYHPMMSSSEDVSLTQGKILYSNQTAAQFLWGLASWFTGPQDRELGRKLLEKAQDLNNSQSGIINILDEHFILSSMIPIYYRDRDKPAMLEKAMLACRKQIDISLQSAKAFLKEYPGDPLPSHRGYEQLAIILYKQGNYLEAIQLCEQAKRQNWSGDWDKRIERYSIKIGK